MTDTPEYRYMDRGDLIHELENKDRQLAEARKDAERYRMLLDHALTICRAANRGQYEWDQVAAIDAARREP